MLCVLFLMRNLKEMGTREQRFYIFQIFALPAKPEKTKEQTRKPTRKQRDPARPGILHLCAKNHKADWYSGCRVIGTEPNPN